MSKIQTKPHRDESSTNLRVRPKVPFRAIHDDVGLNVWFRRG
jgi:hypothetical protein